MQTASPTAAPTATATPAPTAPPTPVITPPPTAPPTDTPTPEITPLPTDTPPPVTVGNYATCGSLGEAKTQIVAAGLQVGTIFPSSTGEPADDWQVAQQYPAPGEQVPPGTYVDLLVKSPTDPCP